jgi:hypothetical protein
MHQFLRVLREKAPQQINLNDLNLSCRLHSKDKEVGDIFVAFNAHDFLIDTIIPAPPNGKHWYCLVCTFFLSKSFQNM